VGCCATGLPHFGQNLTPGDSAPPQFMQFIFDTSVQKLLAAVRFGPAARLIMYHKTDDGGVLRLLNPRPANRQAAGRPVRARDEVAGCPIVRI
jgi:hypothetical protein